MLDHVPEGKKKKHKNKKASSKNSKQTIADSKIESPMGTMMGMNTADDVVDHAEEEVFTRHFGPSKDKQKMSKNKKLVNKEKQETLAQEKRIIDRIIDNERTVFTFEEDFSSSDYDSCDQEEYNKRLMSRKINPFQLNNSTPGMSAINGTTRGDEHPLATQQRRLMQAF